jgi:hypothetical protein
VFVVPSCFPCVDGCPLKVVFGLIEALPEDYEEGSRGDGDMIASRRSSTRKEWVMGSCQLFVREFGTR